MATRLVVVVEKAKGEFFHDRSRAAYVSIKENGCRVTWNVDTTEFKDWLTFQLSRGSRAVATSSAVDDAVKTLRGKALYEGPQHEVHVRVARHQDKVYLDLGDDHWRVVEIDSAGRRVMERPPVWFRRPAGLLPLPEPKSPGSGRRDTRFFRVFQRS